MIYFTAREREKVRLALAELAAAILDAIEVTTALGARGSDDETPISTHRRSGSPPDGVFAKGWQENASGLVARGLEDAGKPGSDSGKSPSESLASQSAPPGGLAGGPGRAKRKFASPRCSRVEPHDRFEDRERPEIPRTCAAAIGRWCAERLGKATFGAETMPDHVGLGTTMSSDAFDGAATQPGIGTGVKPSRSRTPADRPTHLKPPPAEIRGGAFTEAQEVDIAVAFSRPSASPDRCNDRPSIASVPSQKQPECQPSSE